MKKAQRRCRSREGGQQLFIAWIGRWGKTETGALRHCPGNVAAAKPNKQGPPSPPNLKLFSET